MRCNQYCMNGCTKYNCPYYENTKSKYYCSICNEAIYPDEEYIINDDGDYAHWDCVSYGRDLAKWLGYDIRIMEK